MFTMQFKVSDTATAEDVLRLAQAFHEAAAAARDLIQAGYDRESVRQAIAEGDFSLLKPL